jgi:hypothetical protein
MEAQGGKHYFWDFCVVMRRMKGIMRNEEIVSCGIQSARPIATTSSIPQRRVLEDYILLAYAGLIVEHHASIFDPSVSSEAVRIEWIRALSFLKPNADLCSNPLPAQKIPEDQRPG